MHFRVVCKNFSSFIATNFPLQKEQGDEAALRRRITLAEEMSRTVGALDPGFTSRMGRLVKHLAKDRIALAKLLKGVEGAEGAVVEEAEALTAKAMEDVKLATLCLKYAAL